MRHPHIDMEDLHWFMGVKFAMVVYLFTTWSWWVAAIVTVVFFVTYRHAVAQVTGLTVMQLGDLNCFVTNNKAPTNIMSATPLSVSKPEYAKEVFERIVKAHVKARSRIVKVLGDLYYEEMSPEQALDHAIVTLPDGHIKTQEDLEKFISENISKPMPLDKPQWTLFIQRHYLDDKRGLAVWKSHHSLADGMSSMGLNLQLDETYDVTKLIPFKEITLLQRCMIRAMIPFYIPIILWESYLRRKDRNPLHDGRRKLTGEKRIAISKEFDFATVKKASRSLEIKINELMVSAMSTAMARLFKERGDEKTKRMRIVMPANIRWKLYNTFDEVELENKFAPMPLKVDLCSDPKTAIVNAKRVSRVMKKALAKVYAVYFLGMVTSYFVPLWMMKITGEKISKPFTMAFSNTPGVLRTINYKEVTTQGMISSFICAGRCAISIAILSYAERIQFTVLADTCVSEDPREIRRRFQESIAELLALAIEIDEAKAAKQLIEEKSTTEESVVAEGAAEPKKTK